LVPRAARGALCAARTHRAATRGLVPWRDAAPAEHRLLLCVLAARGAFVRLRRAGLAPGVCHDLDGARGDSSSRATARSRGAGSRCLDRVFRFPERLLLCRADRRRPDLGAVGCTDRAGITAHVACAVVASWHVIGVRRRWDGAHEV
jgi:hypothetical protein